MLLEVYGTEKREKEKNRRKSSLGNFKAMSSAYGDSAKVVREM